MSLDLSFIPTMGPILGIISFVSHVETTWQNSLVISSPPHLVMVMGNLGLHEVSPYLRELPS